MTKLISVDAIAAAVEERHLDVDPGVVYEIFVEVMTPSETMTAGERQFLLDAGAPRHSFDPERQVDARARLAGASEATAARSSRGLTTAEAAERLGGRATANVRRSASVKDLYAYPRGPQRELVFPEWQFVDDTPLAGLRRVLAALPATMHPVAVERWMTTPREELDDLSAVQWLSGGLDVDRVVWLADSFARR